MDPVEIAVALARIEAGIGGVRLELGGKLDLLNAQGATLASRSEDHETRIRALETAPKENYVTPRQLVGWFTLLLTVLGVATPFILLALL